MMAALVTGFMLSIVAYLATGIFLHMSFIRYFWLMLGLAAARPSSRWRSRRRTRRRPNLTRPRMLRPPRARPDLWGRDPRQDPFAT